MHCPGPSELEAHVQVFISSVLLISPSGGVQGMGILLLGRFWNLGSVGGGVSVCLCVCLYPDKVSEQSLSVNLSEVCGCTVVAHGAGEKPA